MAYIFPRQMQPSLNILDSKDVFPVQQIYCVGRNYADHAIKMGANPHQEAPFFFMKPSYALLSHGGDMQYPPLSQEVHHEVELVVALKHGGQNIATTAAPALIYGYGVGIDMTRRDLQTLAKEKSRPWEAGKSFLHAAPCSALAPMNRVLNTGHITLAINGELKQDGNIKQMIWKISEIISKLSELFPLQPGDLIFTGTPAGVGPIAVGDKITASVAGVSQLVFSVVEPTVV